MIGKLLLRGLAAGLVAGLLAGAFGFAFGEPRIDRAIAVEEASHARAANAAPEPPAPVSRDGQRVGLFVAAAMFGLAVGGLFALGFAALQGRIRPRGALAGALRVAGLMFLGVALVPALKYPPNPPGVGDPATIGARTALYLTMLAISLLALVAAWRVVRQIGERRSPWIRRLSAVAVYTGTVAVAFAVLPAVHEVPRGYPADLLRSFRLTSLGVQLVLWSVLGTLFGAAVQRLAPASRRKTGEFAQVPAAVPDDR